MEKEGRMIHIRLSHDVHKRLRIRAAEHDTTIQKMVEEIIVKALDARKRKRRERESDL